MKEAIKKQFENAPKRKDDEKTRMTQMIRLIRLIILQLLLTPRAQRVVLVCPNSISVCVIINYTNVAATNHVKLGFLKSKVNFC